jgi:hypothetical protein
MGSDEFFAKQIKPAFLPLVKYQSENISYFTPI